MPEYGRHYSLSRTEWLHRFFVLLEGLCDVMIEIRDVVPIEVDHGISVQAAALGPKPRFLPITMYAEFQRIVIFVQTIRPEDLPKARQMIINTVPRLLHLAQTPERAIAELAAHRPKYDGPRQISLTPGVAKVWNALLALPRVDGVIPRCRPTLRRRFGSYVANQAFEVLTEIGLVWDHPLTNHVYIPNYKISVSVEPVWRG